MNFRNSKIGYTGSSFFFLHLLPIPLQIGFDNSALNNLDLPDFTSLLITLCHWVHSFLASESLYEVDIVADNSIDAERSWRVWILKTKWEGIQMSQQLVDRKSRDSIDSNSQFWVFWWLRHLWCSSTKIDHRRWRRVALECIPIQEAWRWCWLYLPHVAVSSCSSTPNELEPTLQHQQHLHR